jgi:tetratricopeptide (TPR) repeat protein
MLAMIRLRGVAERYLKWAEELARDIADPEVDEFVYACYGLYLCAIGRLEEANICSTRALDAAIKVGRHWDQNTYLIFLIFIAYHQGDFLHCLEIARNLGDSARQRGDAVFFVASLYWQGLIKLHQNDIDEVIELLNESSSYLSNEDNPFDWIMVHSTLAQAYHRKGNAVEALQQADIATKILLEITIPTHSLTLFGYFGTAKVYLSLWEQQSGQIDPIKIRSEAHQACKRLEAAARIFPVGLPRARLYRGWYEWLVGNEQKAFRNWQKSLAAAKKLDMPYEIGIAHFELGRHLPTSKVASSDDHLHQALEIFDRLGAEYELGRTRALITAPANSEIDAHTSSWFPQYRVPSETAASSGPSDSQVEPPADGSPPAGLAPGFG